MIYLIKQHSYDRVENNNHAACTFEVFGYTTDREVAYRYRNILESRYDCWVCEFDKRGNRYKVEEVQEIT